MQLTLTDLEKKKRKISEKNKQYYNRHKEEISARRSLQRIHQKSTIEKEIQLQFSQSIPSSNNKRDFTQSQTTMIGHSSASSINQDKINELKKAKTK